MRMSALHFELTSHCNMHCPHCYNNSGTHNDIPDAMTAQNWIDFARYIVAHGGVAECILSGGEPFLIGDKLFEIMDVLHADGTIFLLITNGYFVTADRAKILSRYNYHWMQVSIDGVRAEYHDSFRQLKGSWERAIQAAKFVSQNGMPLKIAHCVTPYNLNEIDEMCALAYSLNASCIILGEICFSGRATQNQEYLLSDSQKQLLRRKFEENFARYSGRMIIKTSHSIRFGLDRHLKSPYSKVVIRSNGDIRIDGMMPFVIGNVLVDDFADIWTDRIAACWKSPDVLNYISGFDAHDRNYSHINCIDEDIRI